MANKKTTDDEIKYKIYQKWNDEYTLASNNTGSSINLEVIHSKCNKKTSISLANLLRLKIPCKYCNPYSKKDTDIFIYQLNKKFDNEFELLGNYVSAYEKIKTKHTICGNIFYPNATALLRGTEKCPYCSNSSNVITTDIYKKKVHDKYGDEYEVISSYINADTSIKLKHKLCGFEYEANSPSEFITKTTCLCPVCTTKSKLQNTESYRMRLESLYNGKYSLIGEYDKNKKFVKLLCSECNEIIDVNKTVALNGTLVCHKCGDYFSYSEKLFKQLLKQLNIKYTYQLSSKHFKWCQRYRYDFYLNDFNTIIEIHGSQHYNPKNSWYRPEYDSIKENIAKENGISKYFIIDARESNVNYIRKSLIDSDFFNFINIDEKNIDWSKCNLAGLHSISNDIYKYYDENMPVKNIAENLKISKTTVYRYLKMRTN